MKITETLIKSVAMTYSPEELKELIRGAVHKLEQDEMITSASTGGASYQRITRIKLEEQIALWSSALDYLNGVESEDYTQHVTLIFNNR